MVIVQEDSEGSSDSDYDVEQNVQPDRVRRSVNDDTADLLGNFDDTKRNEILGGTYKDPEARNPSDSEEEEENEASSSAEEDVTANRKEEGTAATGGDDNEEDSEESEMDEEETKGLSKEQLTSLLRGTAKTNRHVLYVTNLNFATSKGDLEDHFATVGAVKSVRVPKQRRGGFAFVEMADVDSYQRGFQLHNSELQGRRIKVQFSEAGKKKSANKKNIIKQKNRKLAEMRNETKCFTKSGKFYDKTLKKEKAKEALARKRWRKPGGAGRGETKA